MQYNLVATRIANTFTWTNSGSSQWNTSTNWDVNNGLIPVAVDTAVFNFNNTPSPTVIVSAGERRHAQSDWFRHADAQ